MKLFGSTAELTELAQLIMSEDIDALETRLISGFDINAEFTITKYIDETPITLALCENKIKVIHWLISKKVNLNNKGNPAILMACSNCDEETVKLLIANGANVNAKHKIGKTAMSAALYGNKYKNISLLLANGYEIHKDGVSLRQAVSDKQFPAIEIFLENGVDVNFHKPDMVFPYNPTAVLVATQNNDIDTVRLLVKYGADVTIKDSYGERPFIAATKNNNAELVAFIKSLEPAQWHNEEQIISDLKSYKIPKELLELLRSENRRLNVDNKFTSYLEFNSLINIKKVSWQKHKFLDLLNDVDNYGAEGLLVWYPKKNCLASVDYEHEEFKELCSVKDFFENPSKQIDKIFE